jgi:hypothetical protein
VKVFPYEKVGEMVFCFSLLVGEGGMRLKRSESWNSMNGDPDHFVEGLDENIGPVSSHPVPTDVKEFPVPGSSIGEE